MIVDESDELSDGVDDPVNDGAGATAEIAATDPPPVVVRKRSFLWSIFPALTAGFAVRLLFALMDRVPSVDETAYLGSGLSLFKGDGFARGGSAELHFPPLIPSLLGAVAKLTGDAHRATVVVTLIAGTVLLIPLAGIVRRLAGDRAAVYAAWAGALGYGLSVEVTTRGGGSEAPYALLILSGLWAAVSIRPGWSRRNARLALGVGCAVGLAYLARPEGLWFGVVLGAVSVTGVAGGWREVLGRVSRRPVVAIGLIIVVTVAAFAAPYVVYLHEQTDGWELTAKTQDASIAAWRAVAEGDRRARDEVLYGLDARGREFTAGRYPLSQLVREDPSGYLGIVGVNARQALRQLFLWRLIPTPMVLLALWVLWRRRRERTALSIAALCCVPLATVLAFFALPRYLVVTTALLYGLAGVGIAALRPPWRRLGVIAAAAMLIITTIAGMFGPDGFWHPREPVEQRRAGEWIAENTKDDDRIMTRSQVVAFYAERRPVALPYTDPDTMLQFARRFGARYLVADEFILWEWRPQLRYLFADGPWPGLRLVYETHAQGRALRIFALDPPPDRVSDDDHLPTLAHAGDGSPNGPHANDK